MKKLIVFIIGLSLVIAILSACGAARPISQELSGGEPREAAQPTMVAPGSKQMSDDEYARQVATTGQADVDPQTGLNRMVIYNANLTLIVKDTVQAVEDARKIVQEAGGYIKESNSYRDEGQLRATMTVRVPSEKLTDTLEKLKMIAVSVEREGLTGEDVTDQYSDQQARLKHLEATEERYLDILDKADKIEDVLAVQQRLDQILAEIEQTKGRMEYLSKSAAFATVTITFTPDALVQPISVGGWQPQGTARNALQALVWALRVLVDILIYVVICFLPMALILGLPIYVVVRLASKRLRKPKAKANEPPEKRAS